MEYMDCSGQYSQLVSVYFHVDEIIDLTDPDTYYQFYEDMLDAALSSIVMQDDSDEFDTDDFFESPWSRKGAEYILKPGKTYKFSLLAKVYVEASCAYTPATYDYPKEYGEIEWVFGGVDYFDDQKFESMMPQIKVDGIKISDPEY